jgi:hypothetical protein
VHRLNPVDASGNLANFKFAFDKIPFKHSLFGTAFSEQFQ